MSVTAWTDLVAAALIGTERQPASPPATPGPLGEAIRALDWDEPEVAMLGAASILSRAQAAGLTPARLMEPEPAPAAVGRPATPAAAAVLERVLEHHEFLPEAFARLAEVGMTLPAVLMPELLELATVHRSWRRRLLSEGGDRLKWLAGFDARWSWASAAWNATEAWESGNREERQAALAEVRSADPAAACALVESTWETDSPADRRAFLELLADGLSLDDEPLLERALDDRRKEVRRAASGLLAKLPGSALRTRMGERLGPLLGTSGGRRPTLRIEVPDEIDKAGRRDGIEDAGGPGDGPRARWLSQIIRAAPLAVWEERTGLAPQAILEQIRGREFATPIFEGLREATRREASATWAVAWMRLHPSNTGPLADLPTEMATPLVIDALNTVTEPGELLQILTSAALVVEHRTQPRGSRALRSTQDPGRACVVAAPRP